jgi:hypothetical protein
MNNTQEQKSLLSSIPTEISNIIKEFNLETRVVVPLKISWCCNNFYIIKYKEGYKIDRTLSVKRFKRDRHTSGDEETERRINRINKDNKKYYPIFIDEVDDVIQHMYNLFYDTYDPDGDDDDPDDTPTAILNISGCKSFCNASNFERILKLYMKMVGKVYKKV